MKATRARISRKPLRLNEINDSGDYSYLIAINEGFADALFFL